MNFLFGTLLNKLQAQNPSGYQFLSAVMQNNANPSDILSNLLKNSNKEQRDALVQQAKNYGCPENYLKQIQNFR